MAETSLNSNKISQPIRPKGKRRRTKWIAGTLAVVIVLGGGYFTYSKATASTTDTSMTRMLPVQRGDVTETVSASGTVQAAAQYNLNFGGNNGMVTAVNVKVGDHVTKGEVLATLDTTNAQLQQQSDQESLASAQAKVGQSSQSATTAQNVAVQNANVEKARASLSGAQTAYADEKNIYNNEVSSKAPQSQLLQEKAKLDQDANQIQQAQAAYDSALAQLNQVQNPTTDSSTLDQAQASVDQAQAKVNQDTATLAAMTIKAPTDGVIVAVNGAAGEMSTSGGNGGSGSGNSNSGGGFLVMDGTAAGMEVTAQISQSDISKVAVGQQATFTSSAFQNQTFTGSVAEISPEATTSNGVTTYGVTLKVNDPKGLLRAGMSTNIDITVGTHKKVLYVSPAALSVRGSQEGVMVANGNGQSQDTGNGGGNGNGNGNWQGNGNSNGSWSGGNGSGNSNGSWSGKRGTGTAANGVNGHFVPVTIGYINTSQVEIDSGLSDGDNVLITVTVPTASNSTTKRSGSGSNPFGSLTGGFGGGGFGGGGYGGGTRGNSGGGSSRGGN